MRECDCVCVRDEVAVPLGLAVDVCDGEPVELGVVDMLDVPDCEAVAVSDADCDCDCV